jgi:hypothetical protein
MEVPAKSGITAIDDHYDNIRDDIEIENLRYTTEFRRLIHLIQTFLHPGHRKKPSQI